MSAPLLEVRDLAVAYGRVEAVSGLSIDVGRHSITTLIGPNGAGKSTTLGALAGLLPARGAVHFDGAPMNGAEPEDRVDAGLVFVPERRELFVSMSIEDNLRLGGYRFRNRPPGEQAAALDDVYGLFPRLRERRRQLAGTLSGGERQMLAIGRALMSRPSLLMLDEPSLGLAPLIVKDVFRIIAGLRTTGISVLLVEQNARAALEIADFAYVLERGRLVSEGPADVLSRDPKLIEAYLGLPS